MICTIDPSINEKSRFSLCHIRRRKNWFLFVSNSFVSVLVGRTDRYSLIHLAAEGVPADQECGPSGGRTGAAKRDHVRGRRRGTGSGAECHLQCSVRNPAVGGTRLSRKAVGSAGRRRRSVRAISDGNFIP